MATLHASHDGRVFPVELHRVTGLDALVYRVTTGEDLDVRIGAMLVSAPESPDDWRLADRAILAWLWFRQNVDPNASLAKIASETTLFPAPADAEGEPERAPEQVSADG